MGKGKQFDQQQDTQWRILEDCQRNNKVTRLIVATVDLLLKLPYASSSFLPTKNVLQVGVILAACTWGFPYTP